MSKEPWLADLPNEDWVSQPPSPCPLGPHSPQLPTNPANQSARKCIGCSHRSRILKSQENSSPKVRGGHTPRGSRQGQVKRGGNATPSPRASPRASPTPKSPAKSATKLNAKQPTPSRKKPSSTPLKNMVSAMSSSRISTPTADRGTIQIRPAQENAQGTLEYRRRLIRGEMTANGQCDLFAPIGLENMFKRPPTGSESTFQPSFTVLDQTNNDSPKPSNESVRRGSKTESKRKGSRQSSQKIDRRKENREEQGLGVNFPTTSAQMSGFGYDGLSDPDIRLRSASGQEELRNEGITPISLGNNTVGRRVLASALKRINVVPDDDRGTADITLSGDLLDVSEQSLPGDLSTGTQEVISSKGFVNFRRGGYSEDGSFQIRQLSPSSFPSHSHSHSPSVLMDSKIPSSPPPYEASPFEDSPRSPESAPLPAISLSPAGDSGSGRPNTGKMSAAGSPLKLFGNHDTFTNNKLLRRMSQFEETFEDISGDDEPASPSLGVRRTRVNRSLPSLKSQTHDGQSPQKLTRPESQDAADPRMNRFGSGQLDDFFFAKEASKRINIPSRSFEDRVPYENRFNSRACSRGSWQDNLRKSKSLDSIPERKRTRGDGKRMLSGDAGVDRPGTAGNTNARLDNADVKRVLDTPGRSSTPKRRRTYKPSNDIRDSDLLTESVNEMSILHRNMEQRGVDDDDDLPRSMLASRSPMSPPAESLWDRIPSKRAPTKRNHHSMEDHSTPDDRKRSLTTQDFLDEATKIMSIIRAKGKFTGGLESVEESHLTGLLDDNGDSTEESSRENLSRPPSRDGVDMRKLREPRQLHPRIVSHLKKFADKEDTELLISSVMSLRLDKEERHARDLDEHDTPGEGGVESSPRNIRILPPRTRNHSNHSTDDQSDHEILTMGSPGSANQNSIPTASSGSSNAKGVIASQLVSHLIPAQVNGMTYDRSSNTWVKEKVTQPLPRMRSEDSEDDPFGSIPDLSVDELEEILRNGQSSSPSKKDTHHVQVQPNAPESPALDSRPRTRDGATSIPDSSSVQSKNTRFTSSGPQPETRATSWGTEDMTGNIPQNSSPHSLDVEHEIQLHEGRMHTLPRRPKGSEGQPRVVTISFSSPLVSHIAYTNGDEAETNEDKNSSQGKSLYSDEAYQRTTNHTRHEQLLGRHNGHRASVSVPARRTSLDGRPFVGRPISRIDERNEDSVGELSLVRRGDEAAQAISTPLANRLERSMMYPTCAGGDWSSSFHLSPLADFTVHQIDDPLHLDLSYIASRTRPSSLRQVHGAFALASEDLVKHITDVEPYEPYWEHIRRLNLRSKGLVTLHRLNEFCCHLEELDVSENELGQLSGAPATLRVLRAQHNCISNLTAWGHLVNLQYLDVSDNQLETLDGFSGLIHLRELRANNNKIRNIDGVLDLNGLLHLELKKNELTIVDFEGSEMTRLNHLDLSNNRLTAVRNIDFLPSLHAVDLSTNELTTLHASTSMPDLRSLRLSHNRFYSFDSTLFPKLQLLYLDNNDLSALDGLNKCNHLEILSIREQFAAQSFGTPPALDIDIGPLTNIRKMFLSSNRLSERTLRPSVPALSLQLLDVASCGLKEIPGHFGARFPNLRVLNLNFNALTELGGIAGMNGLGRLTLVGNRVSRLRMLCQVVSKLGKSNDHGYRALKTIDIRGNPLTVGFYPSPVSGSGRGESNAKLLEYTRQHARKNKKIGEQDALAAIGGGTDIAVTNYANAVHENAPELDVEIDDPYTVPPADAEVDQKYRSRLDESTKMKRMVLELMLYAGSGGSIKVLDGLELRPILEGEKAEVDRIWDKLEDLGVLKRKVETF